MPDITMRKHFLEERTRSRFKEFSKKEREIGDGQTQI
jgi:hypothetical protein